MKSEKKGPSVSSRPSTRLAKHSTAGLAELFPLPKVERSAKIVAILADAVAHAHSRGVIHRDIKPSNVMVEEAGEESITVKLTDFGTAKLLESDDQVTRTGVLIGTAAYMAPEQATGQNREVDVRTDIHALGAVLYELLTGVSPIRG